MMENKKLLYGVITSIILLCLSFVVWTRYEVDLQTREKPNKVGCTLEAKICPDGSAVGRNPNKNCEFDPCPSYVFDKSKFCPDIGDCQDLGFESRQCRVIGDCVASCAYGCVTQEWLRGRNDCEAMWVNFECECINNICQRK